MNETATRAFYGNSKPMAATVFLLMAVFTSTLCAEPMWRKKSNVATLRNDSIEATFQGGFLSELKDRKTREVLLRVDPKDLPSNPPLFGPDRRFDLDAGKMEQDVGGNSVKVIFRSDEGTEWTLHWTLEPGDGDLILRTSAKTGDPIDRMVVLFSGCDISSHSMVWVDGYGVGHVVSAPWSETKLGDPEKVSGNAQAFPLVALFQGNKAGGWFLEGRDPDAGPANCMVAGHGGTVTVGLTKGFPLTTTSPEMYEIRLRTYRENWADAVDPLVAWMEEKGGYVPFDKKPQEWIGGLENQAYIGIGDYEELEALARALDPKKTYVGRQAEFRHYGFDEKFPDYRVQDNARAWFGRARELGFHVGAHFNSRSVSVAFPELVERFKPGFQFTGVDLDGNETYESIYEGPNKLLRVSAALKDWRDYLAEQLGDAVEAGVDVLYLDEAMGTVGKFVVDGVNGLEGTQLLMKELLEKYPGVAVQTEQFNFMTAKYGALALSQMPLGHPLSGYIFRKFVKVVPEGLMYSPTDNAMMDAFESWGFMLPGSNPSREKSWMEIAEAYQQYSLKPDIRLPRVPFKAYEKHYSSGLTPVQTGPIPQEGIKLFGFRGRDGVTAYFEKHPDRRGLVIYEPGQDPKWVGVRYTNIKTYDGPGVPEFFSFRYTMRDWIIYNDKELLGLDPKQTYWFDETVERRADRFHVTAIPDDYAGVTDTNKRIPEQDIGANDAFFNLVFTGNGPVSMHVPDDYDVYFNGDEVSVDRQTRTARVTASEENNKASKIQGTGYVIGDTVMELDETDTSSVLLAVKRLDTELNGYWTSLPVITSPDSAKFVNPKGDKTFHVTVGGIGRLQGRLPQAGSIRLKGSYGMLEEGPGPAGDGVVRINGAEVLRIGAGTRPYEFHDFDVDITPFAGKPVLLEFVSDGMTGRGSYAEWREPRIEAK